MSFHWTYKAELQRVVDGDTYDLRIDLGFGTFKDIRVRLRGVDTAEVYGVKKESDQYERGMRQSDFVREWFDDAAQIIVETHEDETGKYGRYLVDVMNEDGESLRDALVTEWPDVER